MTDQPSWHDDDDFWLSFRPYLFDEERWSGASIDVNQVLSLANLREAAAVIDLGCGPGRHSLELARRGFRVVGVDRTAEFLTEARARAQAENLEIEWVLDDIRTFNRPNSFELCLSLFTSFGYFEDADENQQVLNNAFASLRADGLLILELMGKEVLARIFLDRDWYRVGEAYVLQERKPIENWTKIWNRWILITNSERREHHVTHWIYSAAELTDMLQASGFQEIALYGDLAGSAYDNQAPRLVAAARK